MVTESICFGESMAKCAKLYHLLSEVEGERPRKGMGDLSEAEVRVTRAEKSLSNEEVKIAKVEAKAIGARARVVEAKARTLAVKEVLGEARN